MKFIADGMLGKLTRWLRMLGQDVTYSTQFEDADLLIENTQTGRTLSRHNLKIIDTLFESTACLIGSTIVVSGRSKRERIKSIIAALQEAVEG